MAGEERLRLIAEFRDNASAGVRRLGRELGEVRETPGMNAAARWMKGFELNAKAVQQAGAGVGSVMGSLGLGGVAAAGGIAAIVGAMKALGDRTTDLAAVSRETGIAATQLRVLQNAAKDLHVDPEEITKGVQYLTGQLALARRGYGELFGLLNQVEPEFMRKIMAEDPAKAMDDVLARLARIPDDYVRAGHSLADGIAAQKQWSQALLGDQGLGRLVEQGPKALADAMADAAKHTAPITKDMIASAEALHKSIDAFNESLDALEAKAGPALFKGLEHGVKDFTAAFEQVEKAAEWIVKAKDHPAEAAKDLGGMAVDAAKEKAGEIAGRWKDPHFDEKREGKGLFAPAQDEADRAARLSAMQAELDAVKARVAADKNPVSFATREADNLARMRELRDAIEALRSGAADVVRKGPNGEALPRPDSIPQPAPRQAPAIVAPRPAPSTEMREQGLLQLNAYHEGEGGDRPTRGGLGGMSPNFVLLFREIVASGTKAGFLAAFHELQGEKPVEGGGSGGLMNASYGGEGVGSGGGSSRYRAAGGRSFGDSAASGGGDFGPVPTGAHTPLKDLIAQHETGSIGPAGYDTVYGHAERGGPLAPPKPLTQMTIAEVLDYQHRMKPLAHSSAFPVGRAQWVEKTLRGLTRGMDPNTVFSPEVQERLFDRSIAGRMGQGTGGFQSEWDSLKRVSPAQIQSAMEGHRRAMASAPGSASGNGASVRGLIHGNLKIGNETFAYGSGGASGSSSIPFGDYPINPDSGNPWGRAHNAMDVNGTGSIWDKALGRMRTGIEMHAASTAEMVTHGCLGFLREQYPVLKQRVREMIAKTGHAYLHISEHGATITPNREADALNAKREQLAAKNASTLSAAHRVLKWAAKGAKADDPSDTPLETRDMRDMRFAPPGWKPEPSTPRKSLLDEAHKAGMGGAVKVEHSGGAVVEIRGLPNSKGVRTKTEGMISAVNLRRGSPATAIG